MGAVKGSRKTDKGEGAKDGGGKRYCEKIPLAMILAERARKFIPFNEIT